MTAQVHCDSSGHISTPVDLQDVSMRSEGALAVYQGHGGRPSPIPGLPVFVVHRRFLLSHAIEKLSLMPFTPEFKRGFSEEVSGAIGYRSHSIDPVSIWLGNYVRRCPFTGSTNLFSNVDRLYVPPALQPGTASFISRPALYICLTAPHFGASFSSPGYPSSTIRLYPGDAVLCHSLADEIFHTGEGAVVFLRLYGALGEETTRPPYVPLANITQSVRPPLSITLPPSPALTSFSSRSRQASCSTSASSFDTCFKAADESEAERKMQSDHLAQQAEMARRVKAVAEQYKKVLARQAELMDTLQTAMNATQKADADRAKHRAALAEAVGRPEKAEAESRIAAKRIRDQQALIQDNKAALEEARRQVELADQGLKAIMAFKQRHPETPALAEPRMISGDSRIGSGVVQGTATSTRSMSASTLVDHEEPKDMGQGKGRVHTRTTKAVNVKMEPTHEPISGAALGTSGAVPPIRSHARPGPRSPDRTPPRIKRSPVSTPPQHITGIEGAGGLDGKKRRF